MYNLYILCILVEYVTLFKSEGTRQIISLKIKLNPSVHALATVSNSAI